MSKAAAIINVTALASAVAMADIATYEWSTECTTGSITIPTGTGGTNYSTIAGQSVWQDASLELKDVATGKYTAAYDSDYSWSITGSMQMGSYTPENSTNAVIPCINQWGVAVLTIGREDAYTDQNNFKGGLFQLYYQASNKGTDGLRVVTNVKVPDGTEAVVNGQIVGKFADIAAGDIVNYNLYRDGSDAAGVATLSISVYSSESGIKGVQSFTIYDGSGSVGFLSTNSESANRQPSSFGRYTVTLATGEDAVKFVPEPATATLSLLALAGLAARRRRKH